MNWRPADAGAPEGACILSDPCVENTRRMNGRPVSRVIYCTVLRPGISSLALLRSPYLNKNATAGGDFLGIARFHAAQVFV